MFNSHQKKQHAVMGIRQATRFAAIAFFLSIMATPHLYAAGTNFVSGTAFGTNYLDLATTNTIASIADGDGSLGIFYTGTTNLSLNHAINGYVTVSNGFNTFSIDAAGGTISGSQYAVLAVLGGTNLTLSGGSFAGATGSEAVVGPPVPGQPSQTNYIISAAMGGLILNTENVLISQTDFSGTTFTPDSTTSTGTEGLKVGNATVMFANAGTNSSFLSGGEGAAVNIQGANVSSYGGTAFDIAGSMVIVSNGTFHGGDSGAATASSSFQALSVGGIAVQVTNSTLEIIDGTFEGGHAGKAITSGTGKSYSLGGTAIYAQDSTVTISGGTFTGGLAGSATVSVGGLGLYASNSTIQVSGSAAFTGGTNSAAMYTRNSDLMIDGGTFQGGAYGTEQYFGLVSVADTAQTNSIDLNSGTFNSIDFTGGGVQLLKAGTGLQVDGEVVLDGGSLIVDNASSAAFQDLWVRSGNIDFLNDYSLLSGGNLELVFVSSSNGAPLSADTAAFETNSTIDVDATMASFTSGTNDVVLVSTANGLSVIDAGGITNNATGTNMAENVNVTVTTSGRNMFSEILVDGGTNLVFRFTTESLQDYWNATGEFAIFTDELESLITPEMNAAINLIDDPAISSKAVEQTYFTTFNTFQTALQGMRSAVGQSVARGAQLRDQRKMVPRGARAPMQRYGQKESSMRGWAKYYGNYYTHDASGQQPSYESGQHGGVIGIDTGAGKLMVGISGGSSRYETVLSDNDDARENTTATHGNLYATYDAERGYLDAGVAYGQNKVKTRTADPFRLDGSFDAQVANAYLGGGYDLVDTDGGTVFTPELSVQYAKYKQDAYTETGTAAVPRVFDEFDADSLLSSVGMNVSMQSKKAMKTFAYQLDGRLHWMHEFNPDPSNINFRLAGGSNQYQLDYPGLDEEIYRIGVGCTFFNTGRKKPNNVVFRIDFDELFGDGFNSHNLSAKVIYAF